MAYFDILAQKGMTFREDDSIAKNEKKKVELLLELSW